MATGYCKEISKKYKLYYDQIIAFVFAVSLALTCRLRNAAVCWADGARVRGNGIQLGQAAGGAARRVAAAWRVAGDACGRRGNIPRNRTGRRSGGERELHEFRGEIGNRSGATKTARGTARN